MNIRSFQPEWKTRHLVLLVLSIVGTYAFLELRAQWSEMHRWNRAVADVSLLMVAVTMILGPLARLFPMFRSLLPWRREFGIYGVIMFTIHAVIILVGWVQWDLMRLIGFEWHPNGFYVMFQKGFGIGNIIGILAVVYGFGLALTSSDWSQRWMGGPTWKFFQQSSYILWILVVLHTAYFLYMHFLDFDRPTPEPNAMQWPFAILVGLVSLLQTAAFIKTWRQRKSPGSKHAVDSDPQDDGAAQQG
jgi:methionine sulfoxide reductase heme-binding subunit